MKDVRVKAYSRKSVASTLPENRAWAELEKDLTPAQLKTISTPADAYFWVKNWCLDNLVLLSPKYRQVFVDRVYAKAKSQRNLIPSKKLGTRWAVEYFWEGQSDNSMPEVVYVTAKNQYEARLNAMKEIRARYGHSDRQIFISHVAVDDLTRIGD